MEKILVISIFLDERNKPMVMPCVDATAHFLVLSTLENSDFF